MPGKGLWMSPGAKVSVVVLFVLNFVLAGGAYFAGIGYFHRSQAAQQHQAAQTAATQHAQAQAFERRLCATLLPLESLAKLKPPAGNPVANPSRAFEQQLVRKLAPLAELGPDVGCRP